MSNRDFIEQNNTPQKKLKILIALGWASEDARIWNRELSLWDKRKWIALTDFWLDRISKERTDEILKQIVKEENDKLGNSTAE